LDPRRNVAWRYPEEAVDDYNVIFDVEVLNQLCVTYQVKYLLLYENTPFLQEPLLTVPIVLTTLMETHKFVLEEEVGSPPHRLFIIRAILG